MVSVSKNFFADNSDLQFQLRRLDWSLLNEAPDRAAQGTTPGADALTAADSYAEMLASVGAFAAQQIAPHAAELDKQHPTLEGGEVREARRVLEIRDGLLALGAFGAALPERFGGSACPMLVTDIMVELIARADAGVASEFGFHGGVAHRLLVASLEEGSTDTCNGSTTKTRFDDVIQRVADGDWGSMALTEPGAGSDLARLRSRARLNEDGHWQITGQKIFITAGHSDHHLVLARSEDERTHAGTLGLSLFYVPRFVDANGARCSRTQVSARHNFSIGGVERKMGQRATTVATIQYEDSLAELIGERGKGFQGMRALLTQARLTVTFQAIGMCEAAYRTARAYAETRQTMGKPLASHEMIIDLLDEMDVMIRGLRALTFEAAFHEEVATRSKARHLIRARETGKASEGGDKEAAATHHRRARLLTPLIKYMAAEEAVRQSRMAMQIHGGLGYIQETGVEKLLRDSLVIPVYEGTSQIQSLIVLKDRLQAAIKSPKAFLADLARARLDVLRGATPLERAEARMRCHALSAMRLILMRVAAHKLRSLKGRPPGEWKRALKAKFDPGQDFAFGFLHAERLTKLVAWSAIASSLTQQALELHGEPAGAERRQIAIRFIERFEPRARGVLSEIEHTGDMLLARIGSNAIVPAGPSAIHVAGAPAAS